MATVLDFPARRAVRSTNPTSEPVSLTDAKKQVEVAGSDHDDHLALLIEAARLQWERDTQRVLIEHTWVLKMDGFREFKFSERPVASITSVSYYDTANASQTLATSIYQLDDAENAFRLKVDQVFPATYSRFDAVTVTYVAGEHSDSSTVPALDKQAMLLLIANYFDPNREDVYGVNMGDALGRISAYERLVRLNTRSTYP